MTFRRGARLDAGQVRNMRGRGGTIAVGGGLDGIAVRQTWFRVGLDGGGPSDCDTFSGDL